MKRYQKVYETVKSLCARQLEQTGKIKGVYAKEVAEILDIYRSNASGDLNRLVREGKLKKITGKPVLYKVSVDNIDTVKVHETSEKFNSALEQNIMDKIIGASDSLKTAILQAKAAIMYPPIGLHTLLLGETGTGKSMFAEVMFKYAKEIGVLDDKAPFISFNCADYAHNPQLLISQLFGVKKGTYTGADKDRAGLVGKADGGILFLDEVHRLPPEGQEMLFYLIDKGLYRRLGEIDTAHKAQILIICATTENPESALLATFMRRIPMVIKLPPLRKRTFNERLQLIKAFFKAESGYLKTDIHVPANSIKALMLYDCPNNIGQLKSDIKLSCAKAFIHYISGKENNLYIRSEDLPEYVRNGLLHYKEYRDKLEKLELDSEMIFDASEDKSETHKTTDTFNIYEAIEEKRSLLKKKGLAEKDIDLILYLDIETAIKKYMSKLNEQNMEQLYKVVDKKVVEVARTFLAYASNKLGKNFSDRVLYGISMHVSSTLERIKAGKSILNPHTEEIKKSYPAEFSTATKMPELIKENFGIDVPQDEIGFITMFLIAEDYTKKKDSSRVGVLVAMHGESTATSMVDVAAKLLGEGHAVGYNMPLDKKPETSLEELTQLVAKIDEGKGVIILVDMGSLVFFGDIIHERTGIPIKTVEMVSTPMVLEASRKAVMMSSLDEVYDAVVNLSPYIGRLYSNSIDYSNGIKDDIIVTACFTGEGAALKMKGIVEEIIEKTGCKADVIPIDIASIEEYNRKISQIKQEKNIIAVISSVKPQDETLTYFSPKDLIKGKFKSFVYSKQHDKNIELLDQMREVIRENANIDAEKYIDEFIAFYKNLKAHNINLNEDMLVGFVLHIACAIEKIQTGNFKHRSDSRQTDFLKKEYEEDFDIIKSALQSMGESFDIKFPDEIYANLVKVIHFL